MLAIGPERFRELLAGFRAMDEHFRTAPFERNLPVLMGLLALWYGEFFGAETHAVLPYDQYLQRFPAYLQQLVMEWNGKRVTLAGERVDSRPARSSGASRARNGQHAFYPAAPPGHAARALRFHRLRRSP